MLDLAQLIRAVHVNKNQPHSFFLGAGSSISSGVKSAYDCIWEWKRLIFLTSNPGLENLFPDASVQATRIRIQSWIDLQGKFPKLDSPEEYTFYADAAYPIASTRRSFFQNISNDAKPSAGYHLLTLLAKEGMIKKVWTTNFDHLVAKASASYQITSVEIGLDSTDRSQRIPTDDELLIYYLHGDYRYDQLKNTAAELQAQDTALREAFVQSSQESHLIVSGFSGRDRSIMDAFMDAYSKAGSSRLYWCGYGDPSTEVVTLIETAKRFNREAYYVETGGFDDLLMRLGKLCLSNENYKLAEPHFKRVDSLRNEFSPFDLKTNRIHSVIKSNLLPITIPVELFQFESSLTEGEGAWKRIREATGDLNLVAAPLKGKILALGTLTDITKAFQNTLRGNITRTPVDHEELSLENGTLKYIFNSALTITLADRLKYSTDRRRLIWGGQAIQSQRYNDVQHDVFKAVLVDLVSDDNGLFVLLKPTVKIIRQDGEDVEKEIKKSISKQILDRKYNGEFNQDLDNWRTLLFAEEKLLSLEFPIGSGSGYTFVIQGTPLFAKVEKHSGNMAELPDNRTYYKFNAIQFDEPGLLFSSPDGQKQIKEVHPLKGLIQNRPFDFSLTMAGLSKQTTLGIICPSKYNEKLYRFLNLQHGLVKVTNAKENYSIDYPGYASAYNIALNIPTAQDPRWQHYQIDPTLTPQQNGRHIAEQIKNSINRIFSASEVSLIIIFIPTEWSDFTSYTDGQEVFDLHDHIKAFAIQKGVTTQFIEEDTLDNAGQANRIHWWLSLSLYVKTMRTPWVLQNLDANTAFAGIGYSVDYSEEENHIVMGCSHIYNSRGEGLRYRLAKVERPIYRDKRPHLSYEDAYQFGVSTVQLFVEASNKMPQRVVIHKRTFYTEEEQRGILDGLRAIPTVDLIEINIEDNLRFISSVKKEDKLQADGYLVSRGICIQLNSYTGLLYTHGTTPSATRTAGKDFMGGRGIPAPLVIKKHYGPSSLETISQEVLSLTKMNWNSASLYSRLPATIQSSNDIAKIGSMLSRFSGKSYDYRLFI